MIVVVAALKGGVGKTTTAVYLAALAAASRETTLVDADPQGSAADWLLTTEDPSLEGVELLEAPTERLLARALGRLDDDDVAVVDTPPGHDRLLAKALEHADVVVLPTRVGGVEAPRVDAVLAMIPRDIPVGLVVCSARTYTRDYQDLIDTWKGGCGAPSPSASPSPRVPRPGWRRTGWRRTAPSGAAPNGRPARRPSRHPKGPGPSRTSAPRADPRSPRGPRVGGCPPVLACPARDRG
jgi:chromosome partitioning protein